MHFKQIELTGFKSFADRTIVNLESGVTAVVGPNGCGKSNILDAMRWALGEQRAKELRGAHMQDVIFNGSEQRAAMGMAEVTLTFDNADGTLPIDFAEVQITRRVYRSGESEYLINKAPCRLRDVQELFMDTGIGTNAYSMIGQGKIGMVLSSKPDDRRFLFEEAAGIIKYKTRKRVAMRKLDRAEQNQLRLGDIIGEVERQMRSLKRQVNAAIRHRELTGELRELEIRASWLKQQTLLEQIGILKKGFTKAQTEYEANSTQMTSIEAHHEELSLKKLEIDRVLHARRESVHEIDTEMERIEKQIALIRQQIQFSLEQQERATEERQALQEQAEALKAHQLESHARAEQLRDEQSQIENDVESQQTRLDEAAAAVAQTDAQLEEIRAKAVESMSARGRTQTAIETFTVNISNVEEQLQSLYQRQNNDDTRSSELTEVLEIRQRDEAEKFENLTRLEADFDQARAEEIRLSEEVETVSRQWQDIREQKSSIEARLESFRELRDSYEGFEAGVKAIMQAKQSDGPEGVGVIGPVGDLVSTQSAYERVVEAALGFNINSVAIETALQARQAIHYLTEQEAGRTTFLPLDTIRYDGGDLTLEVEGRPGVVGRLIKLIHFDERYHALMRYLFRDTIIVKDIDSALQLAQSTTSKFRIITLAGEVLDPSGSITGGSVAGESRGLIGRTAEIEDMETQVVALQAKLVAASTNRDSLQDKLKATKIAIDETDAKLRDLRSSHAKLANEIAQMLSEIDKLAETANYLKEERTTLSSRRDEHEEQRRHALERATAMESEEEVIQRQIADAQQQASKARQNQSEHASQLSDLRVQHAKHAKSIEEAQRDSQRHQREYAVATNEADKRVQAIEEFKVNRETLENDTRDQIERSKELAESKEEARKSVVEAENQRQTLLDQSEELEKNLKIVREKVRETQSVLHKTEIELRHDEDQLQFFQERIMSEYNIALGSLKAEDVGTDEHDDKIRDDMVKEIREKLDRMGTVNLMAIEEYDALVERYEFLIAQEQDLTAAREALLNIVERIDATIKEMFLDTFNAVAENFREYFRRLFNGGQARIYLLDEDDPLESGIEIEARPPGKKPQTISLLSGGEQAMTAIALLFAIFKAKPSPFCVLDEVDAPLDDANIGRFVAMVDEFSNDTQFVVITHNKQTMARANVLYGVTQQERGISQIVSVRFEGATETESAA